MTAYSNQSQACPPEQPPESLGRRLTAALQEADEAVGALTKLLEDLMVRLDPVLTPGTFTGVKAAPAENPRPGAPLTNYTRKLVDGLLAARFIVMQIHERLEV